MPYQENKTITFDCDQNTNEKCTRVVLGDIILIEKEEIINKPKQVCCKNYELEAATNSCNPKCDDICENGFCSKPNICSCNLGYKQSTPTK